MRGESFNGIVVEAGGHLVTTLSFRNDNTGCSGGLRAPKPMAGGRQRKA
jgi:hypothetical protein